MCPLLPRHGCLPIAHTQIALDMLAFEQAGGFDYMDVATLLKEVPPV